MAYPASVTTFPSRQNGQTIDDTWFNPLQQEVTAIETALLAGFSHNLVPSGSQTIGSNTQRWAAGWFSGTVTAGTFAGSGSQLTSIPETAISDGTVFARVSAPETISGAWKFVGTPLLTNTSPGLRFLETDPVPGSRGWSLGANAELFRISARADDFSTSTDLVTLSRTGTLALEESLTWIGSTGVINASGTLDLQTGGLSRLTISNVLLATQPFRGANGTAVAPTYSFSDGTNDGMFLIGPSNVGLAAAGITQMALDTNGIAINRRVRELGVITRFINGPVTILADEPGQERARVLRFTGSGLLQLGGIDSSAVGTDGQVLRIVNARSGGADIVLIAEHAPFAAADRFAVGATIPNGGWVDVWYDFVSARWRPMLGTV